MKVINLFGGPGTGKSTLAAHLFVEMKQNHYNAELVTEYAKDLVYEHRHNILKDQLYILAKQNRRLRRLSEYGVEYAITDSPLFLGIFYELVHKGGISEHFLNMGKEVFDSYDNVNFFLSRNPDFHFQEQGRIESFEESLRIDTLLEKFLNDNSVPYTHVSWHEDRLKAVMDKFLVKLA